MLEIYLVCPVGLRNVPRVDAVFRALEEALPLLEHAAERPPKRTGAASRHVRSARAGQRARDRGAR